MRSSRPLNVAGLAADSGISAAIVFGLSCLFTGHADAWMLGVTALAALAVSGAVMAAAPSMVDHTAAPRRSSGVALAAFVIITVVFGIVSTWIAGPAGLAAGCLGWALFVVRRIRDVRGYADVDTPDRRMLWDAVMIVAAWLILLAATHAMANGAAIRTLDMGVFVAAFFFRMMEMRMGQVQAAIAAGVYQPAGFGWRVYGMAGGLAAAFALMYLFPSLRLVILVVLLAAIVIYGLSRRSALFSILVTLGTLSAFAVFLFVLSKMVHLPKHKGAMHSLSTGKPNRPTHLVDVPHVMHVPDYFWVGGIGLCMGVLLWWLLTQKRALGEAASAEEAPKLERVRLPARRRRLPQAATVLGNLLLGFLREMTQKGYPLQPGETVRTYAERVAAAGALPDRDAAHVLHQFIHAYEAERYGHQPVSAKNANTFARLFHRFGLMGKRELRTFKKPLSSKTKYE